MVFERIEFYTCIILREKMSKDYKYCYVTLHMVFFFRIIHKYITLNCIMFTFQSYTVILFLLLLLIL